MGLLTTKTTFVRQVRVPDSLESIMSSALFPSSLVHSAPSSSVATITLTLERKAKGSQTRKTRHMEGNTTRPEARKRYDRSISNHLQVSVFFFFKFLSGYLIYFLFFFVNHKIVASWLVSAQGEEGVAWQGF
jgi:hypothetical protein